MRYKEIVIPVGAAVTALLTQSSYGAELFPHVQLDSPVEESNLKSGNALIEPVLQRLIYQSGAHAHHLTLHKSSSGIVYARHGSHRSHGSHVSHRSHRSGR